MYPHRVDRKTVHGSGRGGKEWSEDGKEAALCRDAAVYRAHPFDDPAFEIIRNIDGNLNFLCNLYVIKYRCRVRAVGTGQ